MNKFLITFLLFIFTINVNAENDRKPITKYDDNGMIELQNMANDRDVKGCYNSSSTSDDTTPFIFEGTIVKREFSDNEIAIIGIVIRDENDERTYINIDDEQRERMDMPTLRNLSSFLGKDKHVKVWVYRCGAAGGVMVADKIKLLY
jgi:hypothetical protein